MWGWWTYTLEDFLLFSPRVYWRTIELHNEAIWPLHVLTISLGTICVLLTVHPHKWSAKAITGILAPVWIWVAWGFLWIRYATINWAAIYAVPVFVFQALLLVWFGVVHGNLRFHAPRTISASVGLGLSLYALFLHPFMAIALGRRIQAAEVFGIHPDPTVFATLGLLLSASGRSAAVLLSIPLGWCLVSWATLYAMGAPESWIRLAVVCITVCLKLSPPASRA
jgi:hypothetical protein